MYIQYGCGMSTARGWRNFDASPTLRFERMPILGRLYTKNSTPFPLDAEYGDIVKGLPIPDESADLVYCSHVLEHLALKDFHRALENTHRILRPGGSFRFVLPDLEHCARQYLADPSAQAASQFMIESHLGHQARERGLRGLAIAAFGNSRHLWMWDYKAMHAALTDAGFQDIRRAEFGDSVHPPFSAAESENMWRNCLGVECVKPRRLA